MGNDLFKSEIFIINRYLKSELVGGLILGKFSKDLKEPYLRNKLIKHSEEEIHHSLLWSNLICKLKIPSITIKDEKKDEFFAVVKKEIKNEIDFLSALHMFEIRVPFHYEMHSKWTKNLDVKNLLIFLVKDEKKHLDWVENYLLKIRESRKEEVDNSIEKFSEIEEKIYQNDLKRLENLNSESKNFVKIIKENYDTFLNHKNGHKLIQNLNE